MERKDKVELVVKTILFIIAVIFGVTSFFIPRGNSKGCLGWDWALPILGLVLSIIINVVGTIIVMIFVRCDIEPSELYGTKKWCFIEQVIDLLAIFAFGYLILWLPTWINIIVSIIFVVTEMCVIVACSLPKETG